jgi:hypothetical protein
MTGIQLHAGKPIHDSMPAHALAAQLAFRPLMIWIISRECADFCADAGQLEAANTRPYSI